MRRKMLSVALCLCLVSGVLTGCGDAGSDKESVAANASVGTQEEVVQQTSESTTEPTPESTSESTPESEPEPVLPYVEENGLEFSRETSFILQGFRCNDENLSDYEAIDTEFKIVDVTVEDAEEEGYQIITVKSEVSGYIWDTGEDESRLVMFVSDLGICDMYTGRVMPSARTFGEMGYNTENIEFEWDGDVYTIGYTKDIKTHQGEWEEENGEWFCLAAFSDTYVITISDGYDGLTLLVKPETTPPDEQDGEYGVVDETEKYILDDWGDNCYLLRVSDLVGSFSE